MNSMPCLRRTLHYTLREVKVHPNIDMYSQLLHRLGHLSGSGFRACSSKVFDLNQVARSNREKSSLDGVKRSISQKVVKKSKPKAIKEEVTQTPEDELDIPDWFSTVMELPFYAQEEIDSSNHAQFKEFVEGLDITYLPSVSTVIKQTESKSSQTVLKRWKASKIKELGSEEQFEKYHQGIINDGLNLHKCIEMTLKGEEDVKVKGSHEGHWESVKTVLGDVKNVKSLESDCVHPEVFYRGKFDCIAEFRDTLCLIEWKTSSTLKPLLSATYDNPLQVAAYMGAVNRSGILKQLDIPNVTNGALVFAYGTGEPATVHMMSQKICEKYWRKWKQRLYLYWVQQYQNSLEN
ncbi:mitochondrial genome maintenance exonuclease 1-like [Ruditapes philippinarum]|uniref:mitochondrial genome maintenance exonuclease 1-like n=1 Tax=Ruditapes philippinarum TaxID=129788 RepID=UPI00295ACEBA|nr:mitochondrial genome maintenance exonuclease 1-like [Ruditapes philippinarum]